MKTVQNNQKGKPFSIEVICNGFSQKRGAFYKYRKRYTAQRQIEKEVVGLVLKSRRTLPREGTRKLMRSLGPDFHKNDLKIGRAHELNVKITTGTDVHGFPTLEELYLLVDLVGLSPKEALMSSSKNGEAIGIEKTHGTIEIGKVANLILLNENPLENIRNVEMIDLVLIRGHEVSTD